MEHIRQFDWCYSENEHYFANENDLDNCVTERILRNKFRDPLISSESEDEKPTFNWNEILAKQQMNNAQRRVFIPGYRNNPPYPKLSALTESQHYQCLKVLCANNPNILPSASIPRPRNFDYKVFQEVQKVYLEEQKEFLAWAKNLWTTNHCIRALRPKPLVETIYEAELAIKAKEMESFPKNYTMAAQIPLESRNDKYEMIHEKDLIKVDINCLPQIRNPQPITNKLSIMTLQAVPEPCNKHPCRIILPNESRTTSLGLSEVHCALAELAAAQGAACVSAEDALACLLQTDTHWTLCLSVCDVLTPEGGSRSVLVLGSEVCAERECARARTRRAFTHLLYHALLPEEEKKKLYYKSKETTTNNTKSCSYMTQDLDDSSDDERPLIIAADELQANAANEVTAGKKLISPSDENSTNSKNKENCDLYKCTCEGTIYERPPPRSFTKWRLKNFSNTDSFSVIIHCTHNLKDSAGEVLLEPIPEYQLELGCSELPPHAATAHAFALSLRKHATLMTVRVDGQSGEVVRVDRSSLQQLLAQRPAQPAHALGTALAQLQGLRPGQYLLKHEPSHGLNALLYRPGAGGEAGDEAGAAGVLRLSFRCGQRAEADEAQAARAPPTLVPLLLPLHKYRKMLPCAFTPYEKQLVKETRKPAARQRPPPHAIALGAAAEGAAVTKWPKKRGKKSKRKL